MTRYSNTLASSSQGKVSSPYPEARIHDDKTMNFSITKAKGGWIIEYRQWDKQTDRHNISLYIVHENKDLGEEIARIITYENLYR